MKLKNLIKNLSFKEVKGSQEIEIKGITANSKQSAPGYLFIAKKGLNSDGSQYIQDAVSSGACCVLTDLYNPFLKEITQLVSLSPEEVELELLNQFYDYPAEKLHVVGITGTNGKTTTSYLIKNLLEEPSKLCGLIGTIEWHLGKTVLPATHTTPEIVVLMKLFHDMVKEGAISVVMEVSSHALEQKRVKGIDFKTAIFTNLTQDHLDYHGTMENYAHAKSKLFSSLSEESVAIFNIDDPWHPTILQECRAQKLSFGIHRPADLLAKEIQLSAQGMQFTLCYQNKAFKVRSSLIGHFNVYNILGAIGAALHAKIPLQSIIRKIATFKNVPGRLERVIHSKLFHVFIDYAHTEDALKNVLETLCQIKQKRILTVFGCGGNRDPLKRPKMARVVEQFSDIVILTTDNPRKEDPQAIALQAFAGFVHQGKVIVELDRKLAIQKALSLAEKDDIVLIAGKGHEKVQIFDHKTIAFDDVKIAEEFLYSNRVGGRL